MENKEITITKCRKCGEDIRLIVTKAGKFMPIQMDDYEPHFPHCGKGNMSAIEWGKQLIAWGNQILKHNKEKRVTIPNHTNELYRGKTPPW